MWVLQEYVLAQHIALYYGFQSIEGSPFNELWIDWPNSTQSDIYGTITMF
jgi:hypothetical protein